MDPIAKRKIRQRLQRATDEQFWNWMNVIHSQAYFLGQNHMREAMECIPGISKKKVEAVLAKAKEIREIWDGLKEITIDETEWEQLYERQP